MTLIISFTVIPFFFDRVWILVLLPVYLSLFEGIVHVMGIKLMRQNHRAQGELNPSGTGLLGTRWGSLG